MSSPAAGKELDASPGTMIPRTVAVVDMVGYSTIARLLEENISAQSVADLNRQIQFFMATSLAEVPDPTSFCVIAKTGDGIIVLFHHAEDAHHFARRVHLAARQHNNIRSERTAERWFRVGIATGNVHASGCSGGPSEYAGTTIANAVRLESAAHSGEIVIDRHSFESLSPASQAQYSAETIIRGKRTERFHARRFCVTPHPGDSQTFYSSPITRRALLGTGLTLAGAAITGWISPHLLDPWLHPLPPKRSVVVMAWPAAPPEQAPFLSGLLDTIRTHLSRAGSAFPDLFAVVADDKVDDKSVLPESVAAILTPKLAADSWGANLILAAFVVEEKAASYLALHVVDPFNNHVIRQDRLRIDPYNPDATTRTASAKAAQLLDLPASEIVLSDLAELATLSPANRTLYDQAKLLARDDSQTKIQQAIAKFEDLSKIAPNFALAFAETGILYINSYKKSHDNKFLDEAAPLFKHALDLNPSSQRAKLGEARLLLAYGRPQEALTILSAELKSDPGNTEILFAQATANRQLNLVPEQLDIYRELIRLHPNFWPASNDLGKALQRQGYIEEAAHSFERASQAAPRAVIPLINLSSVYLQLNRRADAEALLKRATEIAPNATILENLGTMHFEDKDYKGALGFYQQALSLDPKSHYILSDIGDCYDKLRQPDKNKDAYTQAAEVLAAELKINPTNGADWMTLAFYEAKIGQNDAAEADIRTAERRDATDVQALFTKARALALLGRTSEAKDLVAYCRTHGISEPDIQLATELAPLLTDTEKQARNKH